MQITVAIVAAILLAQAPPVPPSGGMSTPNGPPPAVQKKFMEMQLLQQRLNGIQDKTMKIAAVKKRMDALKVVVDAALAKQNPAAKKDLKRFETLGEKHKSLTAAGKKAEAEKLVPELRELQGKLGPMQRKTLADPAIRKRMEAFQAYLLKEMDKIDPEASKLMKRAEALAAELQAAMGRPPGR